MYSLKVRGVVAAGDPSAVPDAPTSSASPATSRPASPRQRDHLHDEVDQVSFSAGNPRVEHITGVVHLYRHIPGPGEATPSAAALEDAGLASAPLPSERSEQLCVLSLPPDMGFPEFCAFLGSYFDQVQEVRLVRREGDASTSCLVLVRFAAQEAADGFYTEFNGKPYCLLEPEFVCRLLFVKEVELSDSGAAATGRGKPTSPPIPPPGATELPSCPVCLERLDEHVSGVVTTVCNHRFHNQCLRQWVDSSCPVCRYCQHPTEGTSHCTACGTGSDLWICLICGHVGCGRYRGSHAAEHWQESGHGYALELETQRVWDYASDAYVHRLVRSKTNGKLVEVPAPGARGTCSAGAECSEEACGGGSSQAFVDPEMEEALVASKLDALAVEYNHLLVTQLESQRQYFEGLLVKQQESAETAVSEADAKASVAAEAAGAADVAATEAERRRRQMESKMADTNSKLAKAQEEREFLKQLNDTLLANQKVFSEKLKASEAKVKEHEATIVDLQEQLRDLMVFIEARNTIEAAGGGGEVEGATLLPLPQPAPGRRRKKK